jgi:tetratricopeptide (TPR) repeat protein
MTRSPDSPASDDDAVLAQNVETLLHGAYAPPRLGDPARARMRAALTETARARAPRPKRRAIAIGAAVAALAAGGLVTIQALRGHDGAGAPDVTRDGHRIALADGSTAILDDGATIDALGPRRVRVTGRALLDVVPGQGTFTVETAVGHLEVLGTRFLVDAEAGQTQAAVVRGAVRVVGDGGDTILHAGELGIAMPGQVPHRQPAPRLSHLVSWAAAARRNDEVAAPRPVRNGTLIARTTGMPAHAPWFRPDEYPLPLTDLTVDAVVDNQVARVALDQTFHNEQAQDLEGVYRFALPADAALSRLAMYVDGHLEEAAVVERMRARRIYEDLVYHQIDPALLEWTGAGKVQLRVFPLPAGQDKRLALAYTQSLARLYDDYTLTVPLPELDGPVGHVLMKVRVRGCAACEIRSPSHEVAVAKDGADAVVTFERRGERIGDSLVVTVRDARHGAAVATTIDGDWRYLLVRDQPALDAPTVAHRARRWVILDDVSASRGPAELRAQAAIVDRLLTELDEDDEVTVMAFDQRTRTYGPLGLVRATDRKRVAAFLARERGGIGATDLGNAAAQALTTLAGTAPRDAFIVYLGDGQLTDGERTLGVIRDQLRGKATFVGVGVGDGADLPTLDALAAATGGATYAIDPADDLGWRAFDLVASLYTARVTGLAVDVLGADGAAIPGALAYLRSNQLGDGEELAVTARVPAGAVPTAIAVRGELDGKAWTRRIALAIPPQVDLSRALPATPAPSYLPRLWAQARIGALLLDKLADVTCSGVACPDPETLREQHREDLRKEIVALGKQAFLLSRHTSLLVLENDAMYQQFDVPRTRSPEWAPYAMPATIAVPPRSTSAPIADDREAILERTPLPLFYAPPAFGGYDESGGVAVLRTGWRDGGGSGFGSAGLAGPRANDWTVTLAKEAKADPFGAVDSEHSSIDLVPNKASAAAEPDAPADALTITSQPLGGEVVTTAAMTGVPSWEQPDLSRRASVERWAIAGHGAGVGKSGYFEQTELGYGGGGMPQPIAYRSPTEPRLADLTDQVPAMFPGAFDDGVRALTAAAGAHTGSIDPTARALLDRARAHLTVGTYRWGDGPEIAVDAAGRLAWRTTTDAGLDELSTYDGATWRRAYPELGLVFARPIGDDEPALLASLLPIALASADHLARWYVITGHGQTITLTPAAGVAPDHNAITIDLDDTGRIVAIKTSADTLTVSWNADGPTAARLGSHTLAIAHQPDTILDAPARVAIPPALVAIDLPQHTPAYWRTRLATAAVGSDAWRHDQRQLLAAEAALGDHTGQWAAYQALAAHGPIATGDVALASRGLAIATTNDELARALAALPADAQALADFLRASRAYGQHPRPGVFAAHAGAGLLGTLAQFREALAAIENDKLDLAITAIRAIPERATTLRLIGATLVSQRWSYQSTKVTAAWDAAAIGPWRNVARYEAARALYYRGDYEGAAARYAALYADVDLAAAPFAADGMAAYAFQQSRRGPAGWQLAYGAWARRVLDGDSLPHVLALLSAGEVVPGQIDRVLARAADLATGDGDAVATVAAAAIQYGQLDRAAALVSAARTATPAPALDRLASAIAERQGRPAEAAALLDAAITADGAAPRALAQVRADWSHVLALEARVAAVSTAADRDHALAQLIDAAARWRALDPDYDPREQQVGLALLAVGERDEALRYLTTAIERAPMEGSGWAQLAETFEREGRLDQARDYWHQAVVIDQTNPTWRIRDAQALFALGRDREAQAVLQDVATRRWHQRWGMVVEQARDMLARSKVAAPSAP